MSAIFIEQPELSLDGVARAAYNAAGITDSRVRDRMARFFAGLRALGLNDEFVDGACYRPGFQKVSGSFLSLKGYAGTVVGAPALAQGGLVFDGTDDGLSHVIPNIGGASGTGWTIFSWGATQPTSSAVWVAVNNKSNAGLAFARIYVDSSLKASLTTYNSATASTVSNTTLSPSQPETHLLVGRDDRAGNIAINLDGATKITGTGAGVNTYDLTEVTVGALKVSGTSFTNFYPQTVACWLVFNRSLTDTEVASVRSLVESTICPRVIGLIEGDSLSSGTCWANYTPRYANSSGLLDTSFIGAGGQTSIDVLASYSAQIGAAKPAAGEQKWLFLMIGTNDIANLSATAADVFTRTQAIWAQARADGYKIAAFTVMKTGGSGNSTRDTLNALIRNAGNLYDVLIDADMFFFRLAGATYYSNLTYFNADTVHLVADGWASLGAEVDRCMKFQDIPL